MNKHLAGIKTIEELSLAGKRVLMRVDFNVPLKEENGVQIVADDTRIREVLPTIKYAMSKGAKLILMSHLGRPNGVTPELSLQPVAEHLSNLLETEVLLADDCIGDGVELMAKQLPTSQVLLLENLRFHAEEEKNDSAFVRQLAALGEIYINDAFGTAHRKHASTYGVAQVMPIRGCGFLIKKELQFLGKLLEQPLHPYVAVLGGSKVSDKIKTIENLFMTVDSVLIGGAMGNTFRIAQGELTGKKFTLPEAAKKPKEEEVTLAKALFEKARKHEVDLVLPIDDVDSFDIGSKTIASFEEYIRPAKTIFWNGPLGMFEKEEYSNGTFTIARTIAETSALKVIGGGDTVAAVAGAGVSEKMDHISTGGGASLEFLEGKGLPGIEILRTYSKRTEPGELA
jgi:phosphoglycerate kinase